MTLGHDPDGKTVGILGMGGIGSAVARRALAFGFQLQYHNRSPLAPERNPLGAAYVDFETLLKTSDVISVHLPLGEATRGMIGEKEFHLMKHGVVLVNTARGAIIDEQALVCAIRSGKVFGAGLDVYEKEPEVNPELLDNENVVLMPHLGTATVETQVCWTFIFFRLLLPHGLVICAGVCDQASQNNPVFPLFSPPTSWGYFASDHHCLQVARFPDCFHLDPSNDPSTH